MAIIDPTPLELLTALVQEINIIGPLDSTPPQDPNREKIMKEAPVLEKADKVAVMSTEHESLEQLEEIQLSVEEESRNILQENVRRYNSRLAAGLEPSSEDEDEMNEQELLHHLQECATIYNYHTLMAQQPSYMSEEDIMLDICEPVYELAPGVDVDAFMENFFSGTSETKGTEPIEPKTPRKCAKEAAAGKQLEVEEAAVDRINAQWLWEESEVDDGDGRLATNTRSIFTGFGH